MIFKRVLKPNRQQKKILFVVTVVGSVFVAAVTLVHYGLALLDNDLPLVEFKDEPSGSKFLSVPSDREYRLDNPQKTDFSRGQSKIIDELLVGRMNGFFVEVGAGDGETNSVSLFFEKERSWTGVLVEANETKHRLAVAKNRKSHVWNFKVQLDEVTSESKNDIRPDKLLQMINRTSIDLLIINLNGREYEFIKQIDLAKYNIRVITIELQNDVSKEKYMAITEAITSRGYSVAHHLINAQLGKKDVVYLKN
ncbi:hypothetical protein BsWGS_03398 [Bradybaena similaris]